MTNIVTKIKGTEITCKGNVEGNFEQVPMQLFDYIQLGLITHTDLVVYVKLLQLYNHNEGYAFPTIAQLRVYTRIGSKDTIDKSLDRLGGAGLIKIGKSPKFPKKNIYYVYMPLERDELYKRVPEKFEQFKKFESKLVKIAEHDKERYQQHQLDKQEREQLEQQIQAKQVVPKEKIVPYYDMENLSLKELKMLLKECGEM
ncbi:transcriptional regulator [Bacillus cereus]|uniref:transcriptional regulator n=1 Tax=Bacillus cereus TaxID=1396 RepID=UPI0011A97A1F|nr:transcriptional regulator [Bacillus cereus]MEB9820427.1 transcriptional regulator [Bacillus cereus]MEB9825583.1 transcriptional regulator [Bacillus cereus]